MVQGHASEAPHLAPHCVPEIPSFVKTLPQPFFPHQGLFLAPPLSTAPPTPFLVAGKVLECLSCLL